MRYLAVACDYDGTLATHGTVDEETLLALERLLASGRKLILVTGRQADSILEVFPHTELFELIVCENGAVLYRPDTREQKVLAEAAPPAFIEELSRRGVDPLSVGKSIVATWYPHENTVLEAIRDLGLELKVTFNKGAVMVLPSEVNKGTGLQAALKELQLSAHNTLGIGDAENDHAFLRLCECSVAVSNALPSIMERADLVTAGAHGQGVVEIADRLTATDLSEIDGSLQRHHIPLAKDEDGSELMMTPYGTVAMIVGPSESGKSTVVVGLVERLAAAGYQYCLVDPEGDYSTVEGAVCLGTSKRAPSVDEVLGLIANPAENVVVSLTDIPLADRTSFFASLFPRVQELRARTGRPHWFILDEVHHLLPSVWRPASNTIPQELHGMMLVTVHPSLMSPVILSAVDLVIALGKGADGFVKEFCQAVGQRAPRVPRGDLDGGEALVWWRLNGARPQLVRTIPGRGERRRHRRKYAEGDVGADRCFIFRGPEDKLKLRAQNLITFMQIAEGVDDETWIFHLKQRDYSHWFLQTIKDEELAAETARIEGEPDITAEESRQRIRAAIEERYS